MCIYNYVHYIIYIYIHIFCVYIYCIQSKCILSRFPNGQSTNQYFTREHVKGLT